MKRVAARIAVPGIMKDVQRVLTPSAEIKQQVWVRILRSIDADRQVVALLDRLRGFITPSREFMQNLKYSVMPRLVPVQVVPIERRVLQWVAAFCLVLFLAQLGPQLLIAPRTVAQSEVALLPMYGEVAVSVGGLWQPVDEEIALEPGMILRTRAGEASILFRDDAVVRLDTNTTIELIDTSDRTDMHSSAEETISLVGGRVWVQGLIPSYLRSIDIKTARGFVSVFEGSVSVQQGEGVDVSVWDRGARVTANGTMVYLVAGERTRLEGTGPLMVKNVSEDAYENRWVMQNLERDAVHRRSIAQMQQERRAARAGILPTSSLYPVKRLAEAMDEFLTLGEEARTQKRLDHADTRLDEAAALIQEGKVEEGKVP
ncbi:MAG: DUF5667 domain-containing protein, partial [Candidatus Peribacteraceae bacterium]|nr:DUF5667 domain-containing protein [Candidatus Peribacteraceae bacterium]